MYLSLEKGISQKYLLAFLFLVHNLGSRTSGFQPDHSARDTQKAYIMKKPPYMPIRCMNVLHSMPQG